jgi:hypothetical protein
MKKSFLFSSLIVLFGILLQGCQLSTGATVIKITEAAPAQATAIATAPAPSETIPEYAATISIKNGGMYSIDCKIEKDGLLPDSTAVSMINYRSQN